MKEVEDVGLCLRLKEILGIVLSQMQLPAGYPMRTALRGRYSAGRPPTTLPHRWPHLQWQAASHSLYVRTIGGWRMLRRVRAETGLLKSLTSHRRVFGGSGRFILYRRIVSLMLELPVVSLRRAESASVRDLQLQGSRARESNADHESPVSNPQYGVRMMNAYSTLPRLTGNNAL